MEPSPAQQAALDTITAGLAATAGPALPGTLTVRAYACGKPNCRCHADPPRLHWSIPGFMHTWFCVTQLRQVGSAVMRLPGLEPGPVFV